MGWGVGVEGGEEEKEEFYTMSYISKEIPLLLTYYSNFGRINK